MTKPRFADDDWRKPNRQKRTELLPNQEKFLDWLTDAKRVGSHESFADEIGIHVATLYRWKKDPLFRQAWDKRLADLNASPERTQQLMDRLFAIASQDGARDADVIKAIELHMRIVDKISPNRIVVEDKRSAAELDDDELVSELEGALVVLRGGAEG